MPCVFPTCLLRLRRKGVLRLLFAHFGPKRTTPRCSTNDLSRPTAQWDIRLVTRQPSELAQITTKSFCGRCGLPIVCIVPRTKKILDFPRWFQDKTISNLRKI